jgi:hypothetical protein
MKAPPVQAVQIRFGSGDFLQIAGAHAVGSDEAQPVPAQDGGDQPG